MNKPYPAYRDSGVDWLGQIPSHWKTRRLKDVGGLIAGAGFPESLQGIDDQELPFFKVGNLAEAIDDRWLTSSSHTISRETARELRAKIVPAGSIAYAKIGAALLLNRRRIISQDSCIDNNMSAYLPREDRLTSLWAFYSLSILDFRIHVNPGAVPSLSEGDQSCLRILIPPLSEQEKIAKFLDKKTNKIDRLIGLKNRLLERLAEYRTALITHAVTKGLSIEVTKATGRRPQAGGHRPAATGRRPVLFRIRIVRRGMVGRNSQPLECSTPAEASA